MLRADLVHNPEIFVLVLMFPYEHESLFQLWIYPVMLIKHVPRLMLHYVPTCMQTTELPIKCKRVKKIYLTDMLMILNINLVTNYAA